MISVLIADDNPVIRSGLVSLLEADGRIRMVGEAQNGRDAVRLATLHRPDVVLLDVRMPLMDGLTAVGPISALAKVLMLTYSEDEDSVLRAVRSGASGYLVHGRFTPEELVAAVVSVAGGQAIFSDSATAVLLSGVQAQTAPVDADLQAQLTPREREIMDLLAKGASNAEIGGRLFLAEKTIKNNLNRIYAKLGVTSRAEAMARWLGTADAQPSRR